jgi:hypothetical protein
MVLSFSTNPFNNYYAANSKEFISLVIEAFTEAVYWSGGGTVCVGDVAAHVDDVGEDGRGDIVIMGGLDGEEPLL